VLERRLAERIRGVLVCQFVEPDARGFATELFVGIRHTTEFGPIISAGLGGVEMEVLAAHSRPGAAVAIAPTGTVTAEQFFQLFQNTLSYQRLSGAMRGSEQLVSDTALIECFDAFIQLANGFSPVESSDEHQIVEMEVNPFFVSGGKIAPLDGVCSFRPASAPPVARPLALISKLLRPSSAAVVGVSESKMNMGRIILNNLFEAGFDRSRTYVIRPGVETIDGATCVPSIAELPEKVDLFVVAVGAGQVPDVVSALIDHDRAHGVILIPGGLGEKEGSKDLERQLKAKIADAHTSGDGGPVFLGGNSLGVISHPGRYDTMFIPETKLPKSRGDHRRRTCFISQSGAFVISNLSRMPWFDPAYALSIGNQIDLTAGDLMEHLRHDDTLDVFAVYMEGFQPMDGHAFATAVEAAVAMGKDVVFYKAGRTSAGRSATAGHTASVAGDYAVCEAALRQAGAYVATDFSDFSDLLRLALFLRDSTVRGSRLMAMSNAGFESVGMADSIQGHDSRLHLTQLTSDTVSSLQSVLGTHRLDGLVDVKNPFDVTPMATDAAYEELIRHLVADTNVDALVVGIVPLTPAMQTLPAGVVAHESVDSEASIAHRLPAIARDVDTPIVAVVDSGALFDPLADRLEAGGVATFRSADRAVRALRRYIAGQLNRPQR
jgi:acyl-CoA synthetase (NDP forming)